MKPEVTSTCQVCGTRVPAGLGFCPVCALVRAGGPDSAPSEAPTPGSGSQRNSAETEPASIVGRFENYEVMLDRDGQPIELGRGAMGITYKAFDIDLRFPVTLKVISEKFVGDESARLRFLREARAAAKVRHTNVASVLHLGRTGSGYFYAMEFVEGETLESLIKRSGRLEVKQALEITSQVAAGLDAIYDHKLVHRDIKPTNIMVRLKDEGRVTAKIIDLGLAKGASEFGSGSEISTPGAFAGTPAFASPEQFAGLGADIRSDLYSLGVTLWEMLAGQVPFRGSPSELMHEHQHASVPLEQLKGLPQPVVVLLEVMLEKDPIQRFQSPGQLQWALTKTRGAIASGLRLTQDELRSAGDQVTENLSKGKPTKKTVRWALAAGLCFVAVLIAWFFFSGHAGFFFNQRVTEVLPTEKSIAVLPFENISANRDDAYFADGVQDEILNNLAKVAQLKVISRTSVMQYRAEAKRNLRQIAADLGVAIVLEGTVRREGNHVRVSTELVDAHTDNTIWADSYDRDLSDIFAIQSEVALIIATKLTATLSPEEKNRIEARPTDNLEAYDLYLQAKQLLGANYFVLPSNEKQVYSEIISLLEQATHKDGKFALAYCLITKAHDMLYVDRIDRTPERRALGDAAVDAALRLRPDLSEAHLAYANHLYCCYRDFERAGVQIAIAGRGLSNNPDVLELAALIDRVQGRWEQAVAALESAATLDPRNPERLDNLAETYSGLRRYRDAERTLDRLIELQPQDRMMPVWKATIAFGETADVKRVLAAFEALPVSVKNDPEVALHRFIFAICTRDFATAEEILSKNPDQEIFFIGASVPRQFWVLWLERAKGNHPTIEQFGAAREQLYQKVEADPTDPVLQTALALTDVALGRKEEAMQEGRRAMELRPISEDAVDGAFIAYYVAMVYALANQPDLAFEQLNSLVKIPGWFLNYGDLKTNPGWDPLRKDPRFDKLLAELAPHELAEKSIAVLPFESLSDNKSDAYFADGVQDEILNNLAKIAQLKVISRTSVMKYRTGTERDLRQIANALGVSNVLEGTVRRDGNHVRVSTELIDARNDNTIWADSYDRDLTDIFAIQSEIAQTVASRLSAQLSPEERKDIEEKPTNNLEAYDLYLQAKQLINSVPLWGTEKETNLKAVSLLQEALHKDSKFALAYCLIGRAHDILYVDGNDRTPERRALGDAAVNEALRLRPELPEVHLAMAFHLYSCYRDFERARVQIAIAAQALSNNSALLELTAFIDQRQGHWEKATAGLESATIVDPQNPEVLAFLGWTYRSLRRYRDSDRIWNRLIELDPNKPLFLVLKVDSAFSKTADVKAVRAAYEALPLSAKNDPVVASARVYYAMCARDFAAAEEILNESANEEMLFNGTLVPRQITALWIEFLQGNHPTMEQFGAAREQLYRKVGADPTEPFLMTALAYADLALGRKEESIQEGQRALEMRPISEDAVDGPVIATFVAEVYALANRSDLAFEQLNILIKLPGEHPNYGDLKTYPAWDPLRKDPRFEQLLTQLAPRD